MFDYDSVRQSSIAYWNTQSTDRPWELNGFNGQFAYTDHSLIPEVLRNFLNEYFWKELPDGRRTFSSLSLDKINSCLNEVWEGPGSMSKIVNIMYDIRENRLNEYPEDAKDVLKGYNTPTIESDLVVDKDED